MCYEKRDPNIARERWERDQGGKAMERLTRPGVHVDESAAKCIGNETKIQYAGDRLLELILNGPTLMAFNKDKLRHMMRQLYARLEQYENTGVTPEEIVHIKTGIERVWKLMQDIDEEKLKHLEELVDAENEGRLVVLPCKVGDTVYEVKNNTDACRTCGHYSSWFGMDCICDKQNFDSEYYEYPECAERPICEKQFMEVAEYQPNIEFIFRHRNDFGKTVFLTREEAEAALAADKNVGSKRVVDLFDEEGGEILNE